MKPSEVLKFILRGGDVKRYHCVTTLQQETVAQHSFVVAMLCNLLADPSDLDATLLMAALSHDLAEHLVGDVPANTKRALGVYVGDIEEVYLREANLSVVLTASQERTLSLADKLSGLLFCIKEKRLGNLDMFEIEMRYRNYIKSLEPFSEKELAILQPLGIGAKHETEIGK